MPYADVVMMLIYTGFRISELLSLSPDDYLETDNLLIGGLKTEAGKNRHVPVLPIIQPYIKARAAQNGQKLICKENGTGYSANYMRKNIIRYWTILAYPGFLHTAAARLALL